MTQNEPTEARQDELAGIGEKIAGIIDKAIIADMVSGQFGPTPYAQEILSLTVSSGGGVCICTKGRHFKNWVCPACNGTGRTEIKEKTLLEIIKEATKDERAI